MFDCVIPTRNARHGQLFIWTANDLSGAFYETINIKNAKFAKDFSQLDSQRVMTCATFSARTFIIFNDVQEPLYLRLATIHNLKFYLDLLKKIREYENPLLMNITFITTNPHKFRILQKVGAELGIEVVKTERDRTAGDPSVFDGGGFRIFRAMGRRPAWGFPLLLWILASPFRALRVSWPIREVHQCVVEAGTSIEVTRWQQRPFCHIS